MFDSDIEDAVPAASQDTGEEWFEAAKAPAGRPDNGVGTRGIDRTEVDADRTLLLGPATMRVLDGVPHADGTMTVRYPVGRDAELRMLRNSIIVN
ncbi:hypothetical protein [Nocardia canadensis]|uniref:hypothetical protein n=1 Tax=Nocardia canadensis TaxID=3065238 RepID=UPI002930E8CD|nr:hypothetical protein [Nocardia canadensis]